MLTNYQTIEKRIKRLRKLEEMEAEGTLDLLTKKEKFKLLGEKEKLERFAYKIIRFYHFFYCFLQVNDIDTISFCKNVRSHFRVPTSCLMTKMGELETTLLHTTINIRFLCIENNRNKVDAVNCSHISKLLL